MPYQNFADGIYLAAQPSTKGVFAHFGALDIGNCLQIPSADGINPIIVHQCPPRIRADWLYDTGTWLLLAVAADPGAALQRYNAALTNPDYYVLRHNCEHFARFVVTGTWESKQLQAIGWLAGITTLVVVAANGNAPQAHRTRVAPASRGNWRHKPRRRHAAEPHRARLPR